MATTRTLFIAAVGAAVTLTLGAPAVAGQRSAPPGSSSSGAAVPRGSAGSSGSSSGNSGGSTAQPATSSGTTAAPPQAAPRSRDGRPVVGTAAARANRPVAGFPLRFFPPRGGFYPYSFGYPSPFGYYGYDFYGTPPLLFGGYGPWYDPFLYDPFFYPAVGYDQGGYRPMPPVHRTGSIRLKVSPDSADVYVDGVRVGTAHEFDGLVSHHLVLEGGSHQLELRAKGYETYSTTIVVDLDSTMTERVSLKKTK